jgi:formate hydrogenlyase transcriptional activator
MPKSSQRTDPGELTDGVGNLTQLQRELTEKDIIISLNNDIVSVRDRADILQIIHPRLKRLFNTDDIFICKLDQTNETLNPVLRVGGQRRCAHPLYETTVNSNFPIHDGFIDVILQSKVPLIFEVEDVLQKSQKPGYMAIAKATGLSEILSAALRNGDESIGILTFWAEKKNSFTDHHVKLIQSIANQISIVINNIQYNEALRQREKENETLILLSNQIAAVRTKNDLTKFISGSLRKYLPYDDCAITLYNQEKNAYTVFTHYVSQRRHQHPEFQQALTTDYPLDEDDHSSPHIPLLIDLDLVPSSKESRIEFIKKAGIHELATVKLVNGDNLLGLLVLFCEQKKSFDDGNLYIMQRISYQISIAIAKLLAQQEIERREAEKSILLSLSNDVASIRNKAELGSVIHHRLKEFFFFDDIVICTINEDKVTHSAFIHLFEGGKAQSNFDTIVTDTFKIDDGVFSLVLDSDEAISFDLDELMTMKDVPPYIQFDYNNGMRQMVAIALRKGKENFAAMFVLVKEKNSLQDRHLKVLKGISYQLSIAVANVLANDEIRKREAEKTILLSLSNEIARVRDSNDLFQVVDRKLKELFDIEGFGIGLISEDGKTHSPFLVDLDDKIKSHGSFKDIITKKYSVVDGIFNRVVSSDNPVHISIAELPDEPLPKYANLWKEVGIKQITGVALRMGEKLLGCLFFHTKESSTDQVNSNLLKGVCAQISIALSNILANDRITKQLEEINHYKSKLEEENQYLQKEIRTVYNYAEIIGSGAEMQKVYHLLSQVAFTNSTVLILGETGTGKELIARAIHNASPRKDKLMVKVNCAAIPVNLIESELFGHEKGAFTGAIDKRIGKFELANKSTLFLDEIGEMPLELQVKFLRALQEKEIERVGGSSTIKIDVRIVAATNRNLQKEVDEGRFRSDLFYRLNVFPLVLPPLRNRKEDIPELAYHFMNRYAKNAGKKINKIAASVMKDMESYPWPGNVRELEHFVERSVLLTTGNTIKEMHLPPIGSKGIKNAQSDYYIKTIKENERDHILEVLKRCEGKIFGKNGAAAVLGIPVSTLNSRIKKLGIKKEQGFE